MVLDTIDHGVLLERQTELGVEVTLFLCFHSYLTDWYQMMMLGTIAWPHDIYGKGSCKIYMKLLGEIIKGFEVRCQGCNQDFFHSRTWGIMVGVIEEGCIGTSFN